MFSSHSKPLEQNLLDKDILCFVPLASNIEHLVSLSMPLATNLLDMEFVCQSPILTPQD